MSFSKLVVGLSLSLLAGVSTSVVAQDKDSHFATVDGIRVHYKSVGKGPQTIVFVHGWTCDMTFWRDQQPAFEKKSRVILIDLPGHGKSDKPQAAYTQDLFARAVAAVLKDAKVERAVFVGHSMGTPVIRQFYRNHPEKTLALVIVDGGLRPFADPKTMEQFIAPLRGPNYQQAAGALVDQMMTTASPELKSQIKATMLSTPQHVAISAMDGMMDPAIWKEDKINVPVLAVLAKSPFWPSDNEKIFRSIAPNLEYHMWEGVSHFLMNEKPEEFNKTLTAFLQKNGLLMK